MTAADPLRTHDHRRAAAMRRFVALAILVAVAGAALRLLGARGELWLDEVWTLNQLGLVTDPIQIFVDLSNDNNHILNSVYLYFAGGMDASPLRLRALAIVLGAASVLAAGAVMGGRGAAAVIAMAMAAVAYPFVHYGSEARGYAALILCSLVAIACVRGELGRTSTVGRNVLGAAVGLGLISHPAMAPVTATLGLWALFESWRGSRSFAETIRRTAASFAPALVWTAAVLSLSGLGFIRHGYDFGRFPFAAHKFVDAYGTLLGLMVGIPPAVPAALVLATAVLAVGATLSYRRSDAMSSFYVGAIVLLPAAMFLARLPNTEFPRHFLFSAVVWLLFVADILGSLWRRGGATRGIACALIAAALAGHAVSLARFYATGRGHYADAIAVMAADGAFTYGSDHDFRNRMMVDFYTRTSEHKPTLVAEPQYCGAPPTWWLTQDAPAQPPERLTLGGPDCALAFERHRVFPVWGLSGPTLVLYRRVP